MGGDGGPDISERGRPRQAHASPCLLEILVQIFAGAGLGRKKKVVGILPAHQGGPH